MNAENLKQIIDMINTLGVNSKEAFIWWLIVQNASTYIFGLIWSGIVVFVIKVCVGIHNKESNKEYTLTRLRKAVGGVSRSFSEYELERACEVLLEHYHR